MSGYKYYDDIDERQNRKDLTEKRQIESRQTKTYIVTKVEKLEITVQAKSKEEAFKMTQNLDLTDWLYTSCSNVEIKEE